ncbi:quinoprotein dehydrogenase-associated SoxYZ-like carrier [Consotaella aegiceratis]|uniref:quinoprotein dehydrogenase-associated SoxYZ-like carrier n=1 Tax=Consotaella aegiceratis TaxID=3097961 RepID=UPI002F3F262E
MLNRMRRIAGIQAATALAAVLIFSDTAAADEADGAWTDIADSLFADRPLAADDLVALEAPYRAEDAALVPMTIRTALPAGDRRQVSKLVLVIDNNPAPVAASFELGPDTGLTEISTRVRVNSYTPVHAVAEFSDGSLHVAEVFVKASGGCSAPMSKDPEQAMANLGQMKLRQFGQTSGEAPASASQAEAQLMIRHPNNSGLQMDQLTRNYIPAHFVREVTIRQGDALIFHMEGGISLSEDPNFRFDFAPNGQPISVEAVDTEDDVFTREWPSAKAAPQG